MWTQYVEDISVCLDKTYTVYTPISTGIVVHCVLCECYPVCYFLKHVFLYRPILFQSGVSILGQNCFRAISTHVRNIFCVGHHSKQTKQFLIDSLTVWPTNLSLLLLPPTARRGKGLEATVEKTNNRKNKWINKSTFLFLFQVVPHTNTLSRSLSLRAQMAPYCV